MPVAEKPPLDEALLVHYGVVGMKWGIRKSDETGGVHRFQTVGPKIDSALHKSTQVAGQDVARLMGERYGFHISELKSFGPGHPEYERGTAAYVEHTPGKRGGVIHASQADLRKSLKYSEEIGWSAKGCGHNHGLLTHEASHALFHAEEKVQMGFFKSKVVGGNIEARDAALKVAMQDAERSGIRRNQFVTNVSGYSAASGTRQEMEAELFSQYHWSPNPPSYVKVWGETLHQQMGVDPTPFREEVKHV